MKFNWINKGMNKVLNKESAPAYRLTPEWELYTSVVTTSLNNSFYEQEEERIERVRTLIGKCNPLFVAQLAAYARETMNLRSIPLVRAGPATLSVCWLSEQCRLSTSKPFGVPMKSPNCWPVISRQTGGRGQRN